MRWIGQAVIYALGIGLALWVLWELLRLDAMRTFRGETANENRHVNK